MRSKIRLLLPIVAFAVWSCSAVQLDSTVPFEHEAAAKLFSYAEDLFHLNSYDNALKAYQEFLDFYPSDSRADIALMRMATIYANQKKYDLSQIAYRRLTVEHAHSEFALEAMFEIMMFLFRKDRFNEVILQASKIIEKTDSEIYLCRTYEVLGDTYMSLRSPKEAIFFYQMAGLAEQENIPLKLNTATKTLSEEDLSVLSTKLNDQFLAGYFLFELGLYQLKNENDQKALVIFNEFTTRYPQHEKKREAQELIEEINQRLAFKRHLIGVLLPLTGPYKEFGNRALEGIQFALDQFNSQSNQPAFEIMVKDSRSDPETTIKAIGQFDKKRVSIIVGPIITSGYAAQEAQRRGIPIITLTQKPGIPELGDNVFRVFLTPQMQIDAIVPYVIDELGIERFAVLYPDDHYGTTFMKLFRDAVLDYGATVAAIESYEPEQTDFRLQIKKLSNTDNGNQNTVARLHQQSGFRGKNRHVKSEVSVDFDAIFIPDVPDKIALIAPQFAFYDIDDVLLLGTNLWHSDQLIQAAGEYIQEAIMADVFYAADSKKAVQKFITRFEEIYGQFPGFIEALAYDAASIALQAASSPRVESRKGLKDELQNLCDFEGVTGHISFKNNGDVDKKLYLLQVEENKFVELNRN